MRPRGGGWRAGLRREGALGQGVRPGWGPWGGSRRGAGVIRRAARGTVLQPSPAQPSPAQPPRVRPAVPPMAPALRPAAARLLLVGAGLLSALAGLGLGAPQPRSPALQEPTTERVHSVDPRDTWMLFVKQSDRGANGKRRGRGRARGPKLGLPGPPGPPGPQGPPGPLLPPEALRKEFQLLLKGAVQQRASCTGGAPEPAALNPETILAAGEDEAAGGVLALLAAPLAPGPRAQRVEAAFHCRLRGDVSVERRALRELSAYYLPDAEGAFHRGLGLNLTSGQYTAPVAGFYSLAATLHVVLPEPPRRLPARPRDRLRLLICVQSRCQGNASLEAVVGLESSSELFTVAVNGILYLQVGQYASVFLDNASGSSVTVRGGSYFSAVLLGV